MTGKADIIRTIFAAYMSNDRNAVEDALADDLLHLHVDVQIEIAIAQAHLPREVGIRGNEFGFAGIMLVEIFDDDARLRHHAVARVVAQHGELADRPQLAQRGTLRRVAEVDHQRRERGVVLIECDQRLPAIRCQRVEMQRQ